MNAIKITTAGQVTVIQVTETLYKSLQAEVGGYIEIVRPKGLHHPYCMIVDEEGLLKRKPINPIASALYDYPKHGNSIVGDVCIVKEIETHEGLDLAGLSEADINELWKSPNLKEGMV